MWCACKVWITLSPTRSTNWVHGPSRTRPSLQFASSKELCVGTRRRTDSSAFSFRWCSFQVRLWRVWSIVGTSKPYISPTTPFTVQSFLKSVTGCHMSPLRSDHWYASLHPCKPNDESQALWFPRSGVFGPIFALWFFVVQFHKSGVCGLIFAIWFSVGLNCGLCTLGFLFSLSWLLMPGFWFLCSLELDFYVLLGFVSIFIFLCLLLFMLFDLVMFIFFFFFLL